MASIVVHGEKLIARPIEVVQTQFVDMGHHASTRLRRASGGRDRGLAPLVRMGLQRDVAAALEEDRLDLEERGYARI